MIDGLILACGIADTIMQRTKQYRDFHPINKLGLLPCSLVPGSLTAAAIIWSFLAIIVAISPKLLCTLQDKSYKKLLSNLQKL